jgi:1-acyl-sn-glycerol-3-phosphate acyltransferase
VVRSVTMSMTYRVVAALVWPVVRIWGRLEVIGREVLPRTGAVVLMVNHDTGWDPLVIAVAARQRRQVRALARSSLWNSRLLGWVLDHMGQIPIERGRGDLEAMAQAVEQLRSGECIGIFPEGTVSAGRTLRPLSGAGRLALAVPDSRVVCAAITGVVDIARFPKRPRIRVEFFEPSGGQAQPGESAVALTKRSMAEVRARAPFATSGRRPHPPESAAPVTE